MNLYNTKIIISKDCCGCEACVNICPKTAINMVPDKEGFLYPNIDKNLCSNCGLCVKKCPVLNSVIHNYSENVYTIAGYSLKKSLVKESSSGGFFGTIAEKFLQKGCFVCGVAWNDDFYSTKHMIVSRIQDLNKIQKSKYIQSKKGNIYSEIVDLLKNGKTVLFSGCPCEVAAMKSVCPKLYQNNLYLVDLVCQGPTSSVAMRDFVHYIEKKNNSKIKSINMRFSIGPWIPQFIRIIFSSGKKYTERLYDTPIGDSIRIMQRPSCFNCHFSGSHRQSDITLGDYHGAISGKSYYNENGISIAVVHSDKGRFLENLLSDNCVYKERANYEELAKHNPRLNRSWSELPQRDKFSRIFQEKGLIVASSETLRLRQKIGRLLHWKIRMYIKKILNI